MGRLAHRCLDGHQIPASLLVSMQCGFAANLIGGKGHGVQIERLPARFAVKVAAFLKVHRGVIHHRLYSRQFGLRHPRCNQRSAAAHALDKDLRVFLADAGLGQRPKQVAAVAPIAAPMAAPSTLPLASLPALSFCAGTTLAVFATRYQVS